jgi:hypothetical protein
MLESRQSNAGKFPRTGLHGCLLVRKGISQQESGTFPSFCEHLLGHDAGP